ncbi:peptidoglycan DD-metalloendopeptidase family protein [Halobacillus litoralis]|uniref:G5 domain-containing protein n=1 Tax=Halobacillus litoralis TaxID=45668 RepID=A0A410MDX8_9BACI|nr:peptidoglycan DD-metalloendopeptidase family protein [Halobacillus litoralis]QAS52907.1 hypothetical protein HLI_12235 [Halobacillus litoralis]
MWKKTVIVALLVIILSVGTVYAENSLQTVYHVYVDDKPIGTVENKETVNSFLNDYKNEAEKNHENWELTIDEKVTFESEKVFSPAKEEDKVIEALRKEVSLAVETVQLKVSDQTVAHLPNQEKADQVVKKLKETHVKPEILEKVEERKMENEAVEVSQGEESVVDVWLTSPLSFEKNKVAPTQVNTVEEAVSRIQNGESFSKELTKSDFMKTHSTADDLLDANNGPLTDIIVQKKEREVIKLEHKVEVNNTDKLYEGEKKVEQEGKDGEKEIHKQITIRNGTKEKEETLKEEVIDEPVKKVILKGTKEIPSSGTGDFEWPAVGGSITSKKGERWGREHKGIDIAGVEDRTIKASDHGEVKVAEFQRGFGNKVVIDHKNGYETVYAHLSKIDVEPGQTVTRGESLGVMGTTGNSTGVHLHFEIHEKGSVKNPLSYVSK